MHEKEDTELTAKMIREGQKNPDPSYITFQRGMTEEEKYYHKLRAHARHKGKRAKGNKQFSGMGRK